MNQFAQRFAGGEMIRFTIPTILTMIIGSVYGIIDGIIISTYVGKMVFPL